jgi:hypothetical protein
MDLQGEFPELLEVAAPTEFKVQLRELEQRDVVRRLLLVVGLEDNGPTSP